jgi:hypothetical protein
MSNMEQRSKIIDGVEWSIVPFTTGKGVSLWVKILGVAGESMTSFFSAQNEGEAYNQAMSLLMKNIHKEDLNKLMKELLASLRKDGVEIINQYDIEFAANYGLLFKLVWFAIQENYKSFLDILGATASE